MRYIAKSKKQELIKKMFEMGIRESDLDEKFIRSGGPGGQNVNKTSTCVYIKHIPSGKEVKCRTERNQAVNRFLARLMLVKKIEKEDLEIKRKRADRIAKIRRQKRKRPKKIKERILLNKRKRSEKKKLRRVSRNAKFFGD